MAADGSATVLVVEDEPDVATLIRVNLELAGYAVRTASDGVGGLDAVREQPPDLVLLDVMLPRMDGWQVLRALKEDETTADLPVVMLTALSEERDLIRGHLGGAVRYVTKPFSVDGLLRAVEEGVAPLDDDERRRRRTTVRHLLTRLAELDSGRSGDGQVQVSRLEAPPSPPRPVPPSRAERQRVERLTDKQRQIAAELARGATARDLAERFDVSRSNIYAARKRIARKLGVHPEDVATTAARLGLGHDDPSEPPAP